MIRYLRQEEKKNTLSLWREAFPEDTERFLAYYYTEKTKDNRILAAEDERQGRILSMLHRNPYKIQAGERIWDSDYIVAVATVKDRRHQGFMRSLMTHAMADMYREQMGFCFLMPADVKIYEPFDFVTISEQPAWRLKDKAERILKKKRICGDGQDVEWVAEWMNRWLEERYQVFARRTPAYVERLMKELESEDGWMEILEGCKTGDGGGQDQRKEIEGIRCWWGVPKKEQRMLLTGDTWTEPVKKDTPVIMARIIHLKKFLTAIGLASDSGKETPLSVRLKVEDSLCSENQGVFLWKIEQGKSLLVPWEEGMDAEKSLEVSMKELTGWLFGKNEKITDMAPWTQRIQVLSKVFLDEIV